VTVNAFSVLRQRLLLGRDFIAGEGDPGAPAVVILGHRLWTTRYGGDARVLGQTLRLNGRGATIVGVMPAGMRFPDNAEMWAPFDPARSEEHAPTAFGRLKDDIDRGQAQAELTAIARQTAAARPDGSTDRGTVSADPFAVGGYARTMFTTVMVSVGLVLLIACANVANLLLSRSGHRAREVALRMTVGATRARVVRQLLIESLVLALLGGGVGLLLAVIGVNALERAFVLVGVQRRWLRPRLCDRDLWHDRPAVWAVAGPLPVERQQP
jgi:hypothetical protein